MANNVKDLLEKNQPEGKSKPKKTKKILRIIIIVFAILLIFVILCGIFGEDDESNSTEQTSTSAEQNINSLIYPDLKLGSSRDEITKKLEDNGFVLWQSGINQEGDGRILYFQTDKNVIYEGFLIYEIGTTFTNDDKLDYFSIYFDTRPESLAATGCSDLNQAIEKLKENCFEYQGFENLEQVEELAEALKRNVDKGYIYSSYNYKDKCHGILRHSSYEDGSEKLYASYHFFESPQLEKLLKK